MNFIMVFQKLTRSRKIFFCLTILSFLTSLTGVTASQELDYKLSSIQSYWKERPDPTDAKHLRAFESSLFYKDRAELLSFYLNKGIHPETTFSDHTYWLGNPLSALTLAARAKNCKAVEILLNAGARPDADEIRSALSEAVIYIRKYQPEDTKITQLLLERGASTKKLDERVLTMLPQYSQPADVLLLLQNGLDPNTISEKKSLLSRAVSRSFVEKSAKIAILLIEHGANTNEPTQNGGSLLHYARNPELIKALVRSGLDVNKLNDEGKTPLKVISGLYGYTKLEQKLVMLGGK